MHLFILNFHLSAEMCLVKIILSSRQSPFSLSYLTSVRDGWFILESQDVLQDKIAVFQIH